MPFFSPCGRWTDGAVESACTRVSPLLPQAMFAAQLASIRRCRDSSLSPLRFAPLRAPSATSGRTSMISRAAASPSAAVNQDPRLAHCASIACDKASSPAYRSGSRGSRRSTVPSRMATRGSQPSARTTSSSFLPGSCRTSTLDTSLPLPAVVGIAIVGAGGAGTWLTPWYVSMRPSLASRIAVAFPTARALPPPTASTRSHSAARAAAAACSAAATSGSGSTSSVTAIALLSTPCSTSASRPASATPRSATTASRRAPDCSTSPLSRARLPRPLITFVPTENSVGLNVRHLPSCCRAAVLRAGLHPRERGPRVTQLQVHRLGLQVAEQLVAAFLAADPAVLRAAERGAEVVDGAVVHPDVSGVQPVGGLVCQVQVPGPYAGGEAELHGIRQLDHLVVVIPRQDADHWPEDLLAGDRHFSPDVGEDGRRHVVAARWGALRVLAARHERGALPHARLEVAVDSLVLLGADQRAHVGAVVVGNANRVAAKLLGRAGDEFVVAAPVHQHPRIGPAGLALARREVHPEDRAGHCLLGVRIGEHDHRILAAQLQRDVLDVTGLGRPALDDQGGGNRAGEGEPLHGRVAYQRVTR